jgi:UDP-GlcNAc:undecaprenyl-phosphate GlcNAc-1-phosphate transferase
MLHGYGIRYLVTLLLGFGVTALLTPLGKRLGLRWKMTARPGGRRQHHGVISRLGGLGLVAGFFGALAYAYASPIPTEDPNETRRLWGVIIGGLLMFALGVLDDRFDLPAWAQYLGYLLAAGVAIATLIILEQFNNPFTNELINLSIWLYAPLTILWVTGMVVTVNWLDGLDGLCAGVAAILAAVLALHMYRMGQYSVVPQALALLGAALGFLIYNLHPAQVHLGSSGAFPLGYLLAALGLIAGARVATVLLVMWIPILDVAWTIADRLRHGERPFTGDRRHLHFRLRDVGLSTRTIVALYWSCSALFGALAFLISSRLYKMLTLSVLGATILIVLFFLSQRVESDA